MTIMEQDKFQVIVERDRQLCYRRTIDSGDSLKYISLGVQKYKDKYFARHYVIGEKNVESEEFEIKETKIYDSISDLYNYVIRSIGSADLLSACKGRKIFHPERMTSRVY
ncbi:hypothetical protein MF271_24430 (plasmid) [Deinococcus sp. KNUC1210]|uniref:hypothetical protein n=1 Tax=Deinococcus sp. KNUC1210 TaxID=2917691 RepID=UPI001EF037C6|nr:hypothetical protein [Deinococcus sp. KNUC1210]ULH18105.1 hypothetical protein MF271_24430 [Deinococcus sp. KNUC1210]